MKNGIIALLLCSVFLSTKAQETFYDFIQLGPHQIGYCDSIIYDTSSLYQQFDYEGSSPIFSKIWFPIERSDCPDYLKFGDFNTSNVPVSLSKIHKELSAHMDEIFIRDGIAFDIMTGEPIVYENVSVQEVLDKIKLMETKSKASEIHSKLDNPVIVYHHGNQGLSLENTIMGEYFASNGYIFISANFHLPYPNTIFGLLPLSLENEKMHKQSAAKAVVEFAKTLTTSNELTFIGHSWGAQEGWCFLNDSSYASAFVSMETTIEYKSDTMIIKEIWPYVYSAIKIKKNKFSIPILLFAAQDDNMNFDFFKGLSSKKMIYASYKEPFAHNSYTSLLMMRYFLSKELKQPDREIMLTQIQGYAAHLDFISAFLKNQKAGSNSNLETFQEWFTITQD